jgi:8-oxo-dGTP diphosphatase
MARRGYPASTGLRPSTILEKALARLRAKIRYQPIGFELLHKRFSLTQLQTLYEAILGRAIHKRNFRKKLLTFDFLVPLDEFTVGAHRPARLYRFDRRKYASLEKRGFLFEL